MDNFNTQFYDYSGGPYMSDRKSMRVNVDDTMFAASTSRSSESGSSRTSRMHGLSFDGDRRISHESKPRLSKDQQEILERHFQQAPKPSTVVKKEFSEKLGVSLEKVNNWFQNRRAKVKQEAKKHQSATLMHYNPQMVHPQFVSDPNYVDHSFYQPMADHSVHPMVGPGGLQIHMPVEYPETLAQANTDQFGHTVDPAATTFSPVFAEPTFHDSPDVFNSFFGLDDSFQTYSNNYNHNALSDFSKQFDTGMGAMDTFQESMRKLDAYGSSTSVSALTQDSRDDRSLGFKTSCDEPLPTLSSRCNSNDPSMISTTSAHFQVSHDMIKEESAFEAVAGSTQATIPHQLFELEHSTDLPLRPINEAHTKNSKPSSRVTVPMQSQQVQPSFRQPQSYHLQEQEDLPMVQPALADIGGLSSPENVKMETPASMDAPTLKSPTSGLAARRRQRPGNLTSTSRSISYSNGSAPINPLSPTRPGSETQLRRIKSSGVLAGRVQKSAPGSGQRSPLGPSFPDGTMPPKIARQMSLQSLDAVARDQSISGQDSIPMTPLSPMDMMLPSASQYPHGRPYSTIIESDMEPEGLMMANASNPSTVMSGTTWVTGPPHVENMPTYVSPPCTPMDYAIQREQFFQSSTPFSPAAPVPMPQSAPAWQQVFPGPPPPQGNMQYTLVPAYPQQMQFVHGAPVMVPQQHPMGPPVQFFGSTGPQPVFRGPPMSQEDATMAAMMATQQQLPRRPLGPVLMSAHSMPALSAAAAHPQSFHTQGFPVFNGNHQQVPQQLPVHPVHFPNQSQAQPQQFFFAPPPAPSQAHGHETPSPRYDSSGPMPLMQHSGQSHVSMSATTSPMSGPGRPRSSMGGSAFALGSPAINGMVMGTPTKPSTPELLIHEYSPREPADPSRLPPKMRNTTPRTYSFQHTGPEAFSGSP